MPYRRYVKARKSYKKMSYRKRAIKKAVKKYLAKRKAYSYDGIVRHKFICESYISAAANGTCPPAVICHHTNRDIPGTMTVQDATDWAFRAALYKLMRMKGLKIEIFPVPTDNLTNNRTVRSMHVGSYPYDSSDETFTNLNNLGTISSLLLRKDYKVYPGKAFKIKRYYKLPKTLMGREFSLKENIGKGGWFNVQVSEPADIVRLGATIITPDAVNWNNGDIVMRVVGTYYVEFKEHVSLVV